MYEFFVGDLNKTKILQWENFIKQSGPFEQSWDKVVLVQSTL